jgi:hypothetical protein
MNTELFGFFDYLPECSHSTMNYRKVMTKLNENNVTYVMKTDWFLNNQCQECVRAYLSIHDC